MNIEPGVNVQFDQLHCLLADFFIKADSRTTATSKIPLSTCNIRLSFGEALNATPRAIIAQKVPVHWQKTQDLIDKLDHLFLNSLFLNDTFKRNSKNYGFPERGVTGLRKKNLPRWLIRESIGSKRLTDEFLIIGEKTVIYGNGLDPQYR